MRNGVTDFLAGEIEPFELRIDRHGIDAAPVRTDDKDRFISVERFEIRFELRPRVRFEFRARLLDARGVIVAVRFDGLDFKDVCADRLLDIFGDPGGVSFLERFNFSAYVVRSFARIE